MANTGQTLNREKRDKLISSLEDGSQSRGSTLIEISESMGTAREDYNTAYVLVHYFGYLHRNPDDPPDNNLVGFNFWRDELSIREDQIVPCTQ